MGSLDGTYQITFRIFGQPKTDTKWHKNQNPCRVGIGKTRPLPLIDEIMTRATLRLTKQSKAILMNKLLTGFHLYAGLESGFIPISKNVGIKIFANRLDRDDTYQTQKQAYQYEIAPRVGQKFSLHLPCAYRAFIAKRQLYGYITERAQNVGKTYINRAFLQKVREAGLGTWDMHPENVGKINGKVVCIDFGHITTSDP